MKPLARRRFTTKMRLFCVLASSAIVIWFVVAFERRLHGPRAAVVSASGDSEASYVWRKFGFRVLANSVYSHETTDYRVTYAYDEKGFRRTPAPSVDLPVGEIVFLGRSFTFGVGVDEDEPYPALVAKMLPRHRVRNLGISASGTGHALLVLEGVLAEAEKPAVVVYGYTNLHLSRNHRRARWHRAITEVPVQVFELQDGRPVYRGARDRDQANLLEESPELDAAEKELTIALVREMKRQCDAAGAPFLLLALGSAPGFGNPNDDSVVGAARQGGINVLDLRDVDGYFANDPHPTPGWHREIARRVGDYLIREYRLR